MNFSAEEYYRASLERIRQARELHDAGRNYALAMYGSGLAVECLLRAFRWSKDPSFDGRHNLEDLLKGSGFLDISDQWARRRGVSEAEVTQSRIELRAAMNEVTVLWRNHLRFVSEAGLRVFLKEVGRLRGIKGDALKKNSKDLHSAALTVMDRGVVLWTSRKK